LTPTKEAKILASKFVQDDIFLHIAAAQISMSYPESKLDWQRYTLRISTSVGSKENPNLTSWNFAKPTS
jgi:hypothetical protein